MSELVNKIQGAITGGAVLTALAFPSVASSEEESVGEIPLTTISAEISSARIFIAGAAENEMGIFGIKATRLIPKMGCLLGAEFIYGREEGKLKETNPEITCPIWSSDDGSFSLTSYNRIVNSNYELGPFGDRQVVGEFYGIASWQLPFGFGFDLIPVVTVGELGGDEFDDRFRDANGYGVIGSLNFTHKGLKISRSGVYRCGVEALSVSHCDFTRKASEISYTIDIPDVGSGSSLAISFGDYGAIQNKTYANERVWSLSWSSSF